MNNIPYPNRVGMRLPVMQMSFDKLAKKENEIPHIERENIKERSTKGTLNRLRPELDCVMERA